MFRLRVDCVHRRYGSGPCGQLWCREELQGRNGVPDNPGLKLSMLADSNIAPFADDSSGEPAVRGFLHRPLRPSGDVLALAHGAGSTCEAPLLVTVASAFADAGFTVLRCDLPFRQRRPHGPPSRASAAQDREGLRRAVSSLRKLAPCRLFLGGHSYGGRQASMLAATDPTLVDGLLLLSYPLHPPRRPSEVRTAHFPELGTRALFVHGSRDPFGSFQEMESALKLIPAPTSLLAIEGAGHNLLFNRGFQRATSDLPKAVVGAFRTFFG